MNDQIPFVAIGESELGNDLPTVISCPKCGQDHQVHDSVGTITDSWGNTKQTKGTLQFYKCGEETYLAGIRGKSLMEVNQ